jgi:glucose 1-dehydrogenase
MCSDRVESGRKPDVVRALGATDHSAGVADIGFKPDVIVECTGVGHVIADLKRAIAPGGIVCLMGVGSGGTTSLPLADMAAEMVLGNKVIIGSVNANKRHWYKASEALARTDPSWLNRLVTRVEPPANFAGALERKAEDIKVVVQFSQV